ncbi:MAG: hypothetical protein BRC40_14760 [Cyanobacteria bacterium QH_8_48_120]|jgi:hypothetical protein|nr:MAG: hypothetical protein BRC34_13990 [Cyanobacteria bacterium QH_1_48_107]PSO55506.1 MAG: hypothetical protein BRC35_11915 [Cyanobacteria bacterium QH_10_48_56]PSO56346.1 MAG: hypothetical protein BRC39_17470 [Cyanobacteria bacterium QH_7_48_89]PSO61720.1 MAG: hypothetical protein BRC36_11100 [Cyanobacteria bacterium QH_2_48_84]PSO63654.1 MAG: hypothetical protein BRC38_13305 [Cyanobacteria bacterium QH_6_48_35]PSO69759.1 MAG: hypothetical protein BRC40_14760 [Cyanobacteria bacterium QH_8_
MENGSKEFLELCEIVAVEVEQFFQDVSEAAEAVAEEVEITMATEAEEFWQDIFEPIVEIYTELEDDIVDETELGIASRVEPTPENHPACMGCRHYHGYIYGGSLLVCGMHPYGWDDENCPDWEAASPDSSQDTF